jgi:hypothetical protein
MKPRQSCRVRPKNGTDGNPDPAGGEAELAGVTLTDTGLRLAHALWRRVALLPPLRAADTDLGRLLRRCIGEAVSGWPGT